MTVIAALGSLCCTILLMLTTTAQDTKTYQRTYKIQDEERFKVAMKDVIEIVAIKNLDSPDFPRDFEMEVKNVSQKPIYHIHVAAILGQSPRYLGQTFGFNVDFGTGTHDLKIRPEPTDIPLQPGETAVLKPLDVSAKHVRKYFENMIGVDAAEAALSELILSFQVIKFGDGTGYITTHPYPSR